VTGGERLGDKDSGVGRKEGGYASWGMRGGRGGGGGGFGWGWGGVQANPFGGI